MATAYTSLLGLALPVTGELSGSWGDVVNDSITSLLDSAISGTTSITTDADTTLTTTTGAANQARQAIILWNPASGTVTRNITAPAQSKIYTVINASGGTQSIVFRGAGPTTGVTIVKGESAVVAWNGTDFIKISNAGGSASFTNVTVTGTTTLSGLTASTALALDASKNVVSVTNTGTGNNVLATSPTLVTPALGTPSSVTLTNATGLPVSTGISGLGTGIATALAVNVGTAGAPVINGGVLGTPSSGTVTNLTGTASININGTVGATTANTGVFTTLSATGVTTVQAGTALLPAITTAGDTNTGIFFPAADTIAFTEGGAESMRIDSAGNVGIGTTPSTWFSGYKALEFSNSALAVNTGNTEIGLYSNSYRNAAANFIYKATGTAARYTISAASHAWSVAPSGTAGAAITFTQAMTLTSGGALGIGTTTPTSVLDVFGTDGVNLIQAQATGGGLVGLRPDGVNGNAIRYGGTGAGSGVLRFLSPSDTERMRISATGGVSIGTTTDPGDGGLITTGNVTLGNATTDTVTVNGYMGVGGAPDPQYGIWLRSTALSGVTQRALFVNVTGSLSGTNSIRGVHTNITTAASLATNETVSFLAGQVIKGGGSTITDVHGVLIQQQDAGTNNYGLTSQVIAGTNRWNIYASGTAQNYFAGNVQFAAGSAAAPALTRFGDDNTGIFFPAADTIAFSEGGAESMRITSTGNLGVGTTSPSGLLDASSGIYAIVMGADSGVKTRTDATSKLGRFGGYHYTNAEEPVCLILSSAEATNNIVSVGGGTSNMNTATQLRFFTAANSTTLTGTERMRIDSAGNVQTSTGAQVVWAPAPASISTTATLTNANIQGQIINTTGTSYTVTMPLGTTLETLVPWATTNLGYDFTVINTASGTITMAVNTGVTSLGGLTIATGVSAQFRIRRTAADTFILYRLS